MKKVLFSKDEYYHLYNRGVDKRNIFESPEDLRRFLISMKELNTSEPIGSIYEHSFKKDKLGGSTSKSDRLVDFVAYCLNQNHFHFIVIPLVDNGVQKFMHRLGTGYTMYFNEKYKRSGSLFQGRYKAVHVESDEYLVHLSIYVNLNNRVHKNLNKPWLEKMPFSSFEQYVTGKFSGVVCDTNIVLGNFRSRKAYGIEAKKRLPDIIFRKKQEKELIYQCIE